ncbi:MAG: serine/threonine protein kinase, partial [Gemmataceae bacterium]|nr:serine/threonine protein kinase [Gemmataceae bacterium]
FLEHPAAAPEVTAPHEPDPATGSHDPAGGPSPAAPPAGGTVGPYKLLEVIGEGGMGTVWMADQLHPIRRRVALKVIKPGMDSRAVLLRFEAERQALALMDHPHIARVLDAGTIGPLPPAGRDPTPYPPPPRGEGGPDGLPRPLGSGLPPPLPVGEGAGGWGLSSPGRPYFVMELVRGVPITQFCDERQLSVADRLRVFQQVCGAVQHAHQKGVIHRDLKPSNILVESHDGKPVPKVIDFGLAKAVGAAPLTDRSLFTGFGAVLGTPLYMAPEQADLGAVDVDTRADVYALGVVLYELLTGTTPVEKKRLAAAAWDEVRRVIREEEPPAPSARLSGSAGRASVAALRRTDPGKLGRFVKGDLDWVVMKALAKERGRRYESAAGFAADIERFLNHEPVAAGPPTAGYKLRRFVRRNRAAVMAAGLMLFVLAAGAGLSTWQAVRATAAEREARESARVADEERTKADAVRVVAEQNAERERAVHRRAHETITTFVHHVESDLAPLVEVTDGVRAINLFPDLPVELDWNNRFMVGRVLDYYDSLPPMQGQTREDMEFWARAHADAAGVRNKFGYYDAAAAHLRHVLALRERIVGDNPSDLTGRKLLRDAYEELAKTLQRGKQHQAAMPYWQRAVSLSQPDDRGFRLSWAKGLAMNGMVDDALAVVDSVAPKGFIEIYDAACAIALASAACGEDPDRQTALASRAMRILETLNRDDRGKGDLILLTALKLDPDLALLRHRPDFQELFAAVAYKYRRAKGLPEQAPPPREVRR